MKWSVTKAVWTATMGNTSRQNNLPTATLPAHFWFGIGVRLLQKQLSLFLDFFRPVHPELKPIPDSASLNLFICLLIPAVFTRWGDQGHCEHWNKQPSPLQKSSSAISRRNVQGATRWGFTWFNPRTCKDQSSDTGYVLSRKYWQLWTVHTYLRPRIPVQIYPSPLYIISPSKPNTKPHTFISSK